MEDAPGPGLIPRLLLPCRMGDILTLLVLQGLNFLPKPKDLAKELLEEITSRPAEAVALVENHLQVKTNLL